MSRRIILLMAGIAALGSVIAFGALSQERESGEVRSLQKPRRIVTAIPPSYSKVPTLEIVSTKIIDENTPFARVAVEIRNNANKAVMAVDLVCGEGGITRNGLTDEENPIVVIKPHGTTTIEMTFGEMTAGAPLVVSAVTYDDGTEEGEQESLDVMHAGRKHDKQQIRAEREKAKADPR